MLVLNVYQHLKLIRSMGFERNCWWVIFDAGGAAAAALQYNASIFQHDLSIPAGVPQHLFPSPPIWLPFPRGSRYPHPEQLSIRHTTLLGALVVLLPLRRRNLDFFLE